MNIRTKGITDKGLMEKLKAQPSPERVDRRRLEQCFTPKLQVMDVNTVEKKKKKKNFTRQNPAGSEALNGL